ncbi:MAG: DUF896 domain-containing protein [Clostridiaceae bacterium]|nr:DUF896 domain-containing protein [Clostridiaceae bacterium]
MDKFKIDRINELARKAKREELSDAEKREQQALRKEYIAYFRQNLMYALENVVIVEPDGTRKSLRKKDKPLQ